MCLPNHPNFMYKVCVDFFGGGGEEGLEYPEKNLGAHKKSTTRTRLQATSSLFPCRYQGVFMSLALA